MITALKKKFDSSGSGGGSPQQQSRSIGSAAGLGNNAIGPMSHGHSSTHIPPKHQHAPPSHPHAMVPAGVSCMDSRLQSRFAQGVNYNMKIVIRGDRNTGKTSLWRRLQGQPFIADYDPTQEIQVANITWSYRTYDHIVKVDLWDVVDEGKRRRPPSQSLKMLHTPNDQSAIPGRTSPRNSSRSPSSTSPIPSLAPPPSVDAALESFACDASVVDVYKQCCGVLLIFDVTKAWTWGYVERELAKTPSHLPVIVLANKIDAPRDEWQLRLEDCIHFLKEFERPKPAHISPIATPKPIAPLRFTQTSMRNALGLKFLYNFFNVPFLYLQRECLSEALAANTRELLLAERELNLLDEGNSLHSNAKMNGGAGGEEDDEEDPPDEEEVSPELEEVAALPEEREPIRPTLSNASSQLGKSVGSVGSTVSGKKAPQPPLQPVGISSDDDSDSPHGNKMVDMFEEDLDSDPDEQLTAPVKVASAINQPTPPKPTNSLDQITSNPAGNAIERAHGKRLAKSLGEEEEELSSTRPVSNLASTGQPAADQSSLPLPSASSASLSEIHTTGSESGSVSSERRGGKKKKSGKGGMDEGGEQTKPARSKGRKIKAAHLDNLLVEDDYLSAQDEYNSQAVTRARGEHAAGAGGHEDYDPL